MGILTLLFALTSAIKETIEQKNEEYRMLEEKKRLENIDFDNIEYVTFDGTTQAFRIEEEEEFDPVSTYGLSKMNGAPCYATRTVERVVEDGLNYLFTIRYKNGTDIYRAFHESSPLVDKLFNFINKTANEKTCVIMGDTLVVDGVGNTIDFIESQEENADSDGNDF